MSTLLFAFLLAAQDFPVSLAAEPDALPLVMPWGKEMTLASGPLGRHATASLAVYGRISYPSQTDVTVDGVTWADLFDPGYGVSVEADVSSVLSPDLAIGGYVSVGWDSFGGNTDRDDFGDSVRTHTMELVTVIAGVKSTGWFSPIFFWEGRMGVGMVHYQAVLADFDVGGIVTTDQEFFKASNRFVFEMGGRIGIGTPTFAIDFGMGFRIMDAPNRGKDVTSFVDPDALSTFMLELGLMLRF